MAEPTTLTCPVTIEILPANRLRVGLSLSIRPAYFDISPRVINEGPRQLNTSDAVTVQVVWLATPTLRASGTAQIR